MKDITQKVDKIIDKCLIECEFNLPSDIILYSTFFKNAICGVILSITTITEDKLEEKEKQLKLYTKEIYNKLKRIIKEKGLAKYLAVGQLPKIDNICSEDNNKNILYYNLLSTINIYLIKTDDCFEGYLNLMESNND